MHSIRVKITSLTIAAILTSIIVLGGFGILTIGIQSDQSSADRMQLIADNTAQLLDSYLQSLQQSVDMAIRIAEDSLDGLDPAILLEPERTPEQRAALDAAMTAHCGHVEHAFTAVANNTSGIVTYYYCINSDLGSSEHGFFFSRLGSEDFLRREPLLSYELDPKDVEHTTWYYTPIAEGHALWIGPYLAHYLGELWTVSYVAPIYSGGVLLGVLGMDILFDTMTEPVRDLVIYDSGFVTVLDAESRILYHPHMVVYDAPSKASAMLDTEMFRAKSSGGELIRYTADGQTRQLAYATLSNGMKVVVSAPVKEITASQRQLTVLLVLATLVLLVIFAALAVVSVGSVTDPLQRLAAASRELVAGNYDVELLEAGKDEVGELTEAFRQMRDHMKLYISDLNSRAYTDALTGVKNKGAFDIYAARLDEAIRRGDRDVRFAVVMFDCNRLKQINDAYGHERGDAYLKNACAVICAVFARSPVFRIGGDEFAALLQRGDYEERMALLSAFDEQAARCSAGADAPWKTVSLSRGMAEFDPASDVDVHSVLRRADRLMYEDKRGSRQSPDAPGE